MVLGLRSSEREKERIREIILKFTQQLTATLYHPSPAPCMPQNLLSSTDCRSDVLTSTWDRAEGALAYTVEAWGNKDESNRYNCSSFTNTCAIPSVHCGESLTMYITAFDDNCPSYRTLGQVAETGETWSTLHCQ